MSSKRIKLNFKILKSEPLYPRGKGAYEIVRLMCSIRFKTLKGWTRPFRGVIDTGAHTTLIPLSLWRQLLCKSIKKTMVQGIVAREECSIPVIIGRVWGQFLDEEDNQSKELEVISYLALTDETPLIIGFKDLLEKFNVYFDFQSKEAYLKEQR